MAIAAPEVSFSLGTWAAEAGITRDVLRRIMSEAGIQPAGKRGGHPVYRARDVIAALSADRDGVDDPDKLKPLERKAHYQAEHEKLRLQIERGELVPSLEVEQGHGQIFAIVTQMYDTLPDVLERDVGLTPQQLVRVEKHLDEAREALYQALNADEDDADSAATDRA
jgi:ABC-type phosphate transport system auxiliary subunit